MDSEYSNLALTWKTKIDSNDFYGTKELLQLNSSTSINDILILTELESLVQFISPLGYACKRGRHEIVELILNSTNVDINIKDSTGNSCLILATLYGKLEIVELLLAQTQTNVNEINNNGETALIIASMHKRVKITALLMKRNDVKIRTMDKNGTNAFMAACDSGCIDIVRLLFDKKAVLINIYNEDGFTPLIFACKCGHLPVVDFLLKNGADVNLKDKMNHTALMWACYNDDITIILSLIKNGVHVNVACNGFTALSLCDSSEIATLLIRNGANICGSLKSNPSVLITERYAHEIDKLIEEIKVKKSEKLNKIADQRKYTIDTILEDFES